MSEWDRRLRVVFFAHSLRGRGTEQTLIRLLRYLSRGRFRPMLLLVRKEGELLPQVPGDVPVIELAPGAKRTSWALAALARELRRLRPTVAFGVHTSPSRLLCALPAAGKGLQVVCYETDPFRRVEAPKRMYGLRRAVTSVLYRRASAIVAASEVVADDLRRELRLPAERIRLIPNPCIDEDLEARAAEPVTHPAFTGAVPVVIAVGGLYVHKRRDLLLKAFARVLDEQPAELILIGAGPEEARLRSLAHHLGVAERVHFLGYQANPFKYMAKSDIFVSPSDTEGFDIATVEAMACGLPVVVSDGPRFQAVRHGKNGLVFRAGDAAALAASILALLRNRGLARHLGGAAKECVQGLRTTAIVRRYEDLMMEVAAGGWGR